MCLCKLHCHFFECIIIFWSCWVTYLKYAAGNFFVPSFSLETEYICVWCFVASTVEVTRDKRVGCLVLGLLGCDMVSYPRGMAISYALNAWIRNCLHRVWK